jgi:hypothetical protein
VTPRLRFVIWRIQDILGKEGLAGGLLLVAAAIVAMHGWSTTARVAATRDALEQVRNAPADVTKPSPLVHQTNVPATTLPRRSEIPGLLANLARLASIAKVDASTARYEYLPGSPSVPAHLEVRLEIRAKYGALRPFVAMVSNAIPAIALREFTARRIAPDSDDLQAELKFAVVLAEDPR